MNYKINETYDLKKFTDIRESIHRNLGDLIKKVEEYIVY